MSLKKKQIIEKRKADFEAQMQKRMAYLESKGLEPKKAAKDTIVRKIKADIKALNGRLKFFIENEKITEDAAKAKADKAAAPKEEKSTGKAAKPEKAEKPKKGGDEAKEKKPKAEKKPAAPKE